MRTEDGYIIRKCLNGESEAFGFLVDKYKESIYGFAYAKLLNFHDAEDVTQEVFIKAYQKLRTLRRWDNFHAWLYSITSNLCKMWVRARSRRPDSEFVEDRDPGILEALSIDSYRENLTRGSLHESLQEALNSLPEMYRQVLTLHYLSGMDHKEIAGFLGVSPMTILQRLRRARSQLKEEMLAMMTTTFGAQKLSSGFTFRILEAVKRIKIQPIPRTTGLPWGLALATGIILAILSIGSHLNLSHFMKPPLDSTLSGEMAAAEVGEIPVDILNISRMSAISSKQGDDYGGGIMLPHQQNAVLLAPRGEGDEFPEEPAAHLGRGIASSIAYSPDGKLLAIAGMLGIWLHDATDLSEIGLLTGHTGQVYPVVFSPDGKTMASGGEDKTIRLWDVDRQEQVGVLRGHTELVYSLAFSPDGKLIASGSDDTTIRLWNVDGQKQLGLLQGHTGSVSSIAFTADGKTLASGGEWNDNTVRLWDFDGQKQIGILLEHEESIRMIAFSPDGKILASASGWTDNTVRLWDVDGQKQIGVLVGAGPIAFSPNGKMLVLASGLPDNALLLWDVQKQEQMGMLLGHEKWVENVAFSPDGKVLASAGGYSDNTVRLWDVQKEEQIGVLEGYMGWVWSGDFSPDGELLALGGSSATIRLWDVQRQKQASSLIGTGEGEWGATRSLAFSPDGKLLASGFHWGQACLWDVQEKKQLVELLGHKEAVMGIAFSPDGKLLASASYDDTVGIWDVEEQKQVGSLQHGGDVFTAVFSPDGETLATGGAENTVYLWDVETERQLDVLRGHTSWVKTVAFSPDGKLLASGGATTIRLWNVQKQKQIGSLFGHTADVRSLAFSPGGELLASGSGDATVRIWDVRKQEQVAELEGHKERVFFVGFSSDGKWFASGSHEGTALLWEVNIDVTGISIEPRGKLPSTWGKVKKTTLLQNFPNPFNPETWIPFSLSEPKRVRIEIHTSTGQLIRTLDLGQKAPGTYLSKEEAAYWDGRNEAGEQVASSAYFYTIQAGDFTATKKMVVAR